MSKPPNDQYDNAVAERRTEAALRAAFHMPAKPQSEMKLSKRRGKPKKSLVRKRKMKKLGQ